MERMGQLLNVEVSSPLFSRGASSLYRGRDNSTKFAVFRDNRDNIVRRKQGTFRDDFKPYCGFVQFFEHDFKFVNEVGSAFRTSRLPIIGGGRGSGSQN